ncbi:MAG TPA: hypothetical protein VFW20_08835, partial [Candidatus Limnocylindrales bacterium]|nr:hypothetical protein [Candidatus Limnocylindrales bacterium]
SLGSNSYLIGDGVTLVFDSNWPNPTGGQGIVLGANSALVLNTSLSSNQDCTAWHSTNESFPLCPLSADGLAAAWMIDPSDTTAGASTWGGPCADAYPCTVQRWPTSGTDYNPTANYRGVTMYFRPKTNGSTDPANYSILGRFSMSGTSGSEPGIAFRGILYAPYDDVVITGGNGFNTVGMVLSWTAKFAGQATIKLDYPYDRIPASPYLLEPDVSQ